MNKEAEKRIAAKLAKTMAMLCVRNTVKRQSKIRPLAGTKPGQRRVPAAMARAPHSWRVPWRFGPPGQACVG